jgi:hypothetical protein
MACLTGFAWSKAAFVGVGVSAFQPMGTFTLNGKRGSEYLFSIPDTNETINSMERAAANMAPNEVPSNSGKNSQNISEEICMGAITLCSLLHKMYVLCQYYTVF